MRVSGIIPTNDSGRGKTRRERRKLRVVPYACRQVGLLAGSLKGSWQQARGAR
jgi:hypothetical protein